MIAKLPKTIKVFTDGCAKGNPGPAGVGYVLQSIDGLVLDEGFADLGIATNNEAEYRALIMAMERCIELGIKSAYFFTDSELMAKQLTGVYKIKNDRLAELAKKVSALRKQFEKFQLTHVRRELNARADKLANKALERKEETAAEG